jgi:STE24 endopeptidase
VIYPTWIAPLFNKFEPLPDESLKARVQGLMQRCGFAAQGLFVMDGSKRSAHANAYFTGLGASKRVVFFDTLLQRLSPGEVEAVLAHELGHFKHKHVMQRMLGIFGATGAGLALLGWLSLQSGFYAGLGVQPNMAAPNHALALLLFMMALPSFTFFISPLLAHWSRRHEFQADAYACAQADGRDLAKALLKLHEDNASTLTPDPLYVRFYYSHPPAGERLAALPAP